MSFLREHIERLKSVRTRIEQEAQKAVRDNTDLIIRLLQEQLSDGIMSDGSSAPEYAPFTRKIAYEERSETGLPEGSKYGTWDFKWYGYFFDSMNVVVSGDIYEITADSDRIQQITSHPDIGSRKFMELTKENENRIIREEIVPEMYDDVIDVLNNLGRNP